MSTERLRLNHVRIAVPDVSRLAAVLRDRIGSEPVWVMDRPDATVSQWVVRLGVHDLEVFAALDGAGVPDIIVSLHRAGNVFARWTLRTDDIDAVCQRLGIEASDEQEWTDALGRPWRLRHAGVSESSANPSLPYFLEYRDRPEPIAQVEPTLPARISLLEVGGDTDAVKSWLGTTSLPSAELPVQFVDRPPGVWAVTVATGDGTEVRLAAEELL